METKLIQGHSEAGRAGFELISGTAQAHAGVSEGGIFVCLHKRRPTPCIWSTYRLLISTLGPMILQQLIYLVTFTNQLYK